MRGAADSFKRVALELGGKGANLIFADADEKAVKRGVIHCMNNTGQSCNAPTRMLVERSRYARAVEEAAEVAASIKVGPAHEEGRHIGPVVNEAQFDKIQGLIQQGIDEGARLVAGGTGRPEGFNRGFFVRPTVFADVTGDMTIAREEIFGPVLSIMPFDSEEEALAIANDTPYGLGAVIQTTNPEAALDLANRLEVGMVHINEPPGSEAELPFGGVKRSGFGRELGKDGMDEFVNRQMVKMAR